MSLEQRGIFSSIVSRFTRRGRKPAGQKTRPGARRTSRALEVLEERRMMISNVFIDFGNAFDRDELGQFADIGFLNIDGDLEDNLIIENGPQPGGAALQVTSGIITGPEVHLISMLDVVLQTNPIDFNADGFIDGLDVIDLQNSIISMIGRVLEPFDVNVIPIGPLPPVREGEAQYEITEVEDAVGWIESNNFGVAPFPEFGSDDVYILICGVFSEEIDFLNPVTGEEDPFIFPLNVPISATFAMNVIAPFGTPDRWDVPAVVDASYFLSRVTTFGGFADIAMANAANYAVGVASGLTEVENGTQGPFTSFSNSDVALMNQSAAFIEGGVADGAGNPFADDPTQPVHAISAEHLAVFSRFDMMQNGLDLQQFLEQPTLGNPSIINIPPFPFPGPQVVPLTTINTNPNQRVNLYDQMVNDRDLGRNPDVEYVTGTGAFDKITITKLGSNRATVSVSAYRDDSFSNGSLIETQSYTINLSKIVTAGRLGSAEPFRLIIEGCTNRDQILLDPKLGINVVVYGGPDVELLKFEGDGAMNAVYTPRAPINPLVEPFESPVLPEGFVPAAAGVLQFSGSFGTTSVQVKSFNAINNSRVRLNNINKLTYRAPGDFDTEFNVTSPRADVWNIAGVVESSSIFLDDALTGNLEFYKVKNLEINTTAGDGAAPGDGDDNIISFRTAGALSRDLASVTIKMGKGVDALSVNDVDSIDDMNYQITAKNVLPSPTNQAAFSGYAYGGVETLTVNGTTGSNGFVVSPSATTEMFILGDDPPFGSADGDLLAIRFTGTEGATFVPSGPGNGTWVFDNRQSVSFSSIEDLAVPAIIAVTGSSDTGRGQPLVKVYDANSTEVLFEFFAYEESFRGGVRLTTGDVTGPGGVPDGIADIITAPGPGRAGEVRIFSGADGTLASSFFPEGAGFRDGLNVAVGDADGDGDLEIVTSIGRGRTMVRIFRVNAGGTFSRLNSFRPYGADVISGAVVAAGDTDGDGIAEIITAPGVGAQTTVRIFDGLEGRRIRQFNAFESSFRNGMALAAGDADGDGIVEIFAGAGTGGGSRVRVFSPLGQLRKQFVAFTGSTINSPVRLAAIDPSGVGQVQLFTSQGNDGRTRNIRLWDPLTATLVDSIFEDAIEFNGGVNLG